jgi:hypothetical protein
MAKVSNKTMLRGRMFVALLQIQQKHPRLRIGQIIANATSGCIEDMPDEGMVKALETYSSKRATETNDG